MQEGSQQRCQELVQLCHPVGPVGQKQDSQQLANTIFKIIDNHPGTQLALYSESFVREMAVGCIQRWEVKALIS